MRNLLSIVVGLLFTLISCNDSVTIPKSEYNKLKDVKTQTKKLLLFQKLVVLVMTNGK